MFIVPFNAAVISSLFEIITFATTIEKLLLLLSSAYLKISYKFTSCLSIIAQLPLLSIYQFKFHIPIIPREQILRIDSPFILPKNTYSDFQCKPDVKNMFVAKQSSLETISIQPQVSL